MGKSSDDTNKMKFEIPKDRFPYKDSIGQNLEIKLDDPQEIEYNGKQLLHVRLQFYGASQPIMVLRDANNQGYDPEKTYRLVPGYRTAELNNTNKGASTEVEPVLAPDREELSGLFLRAGIVKNKNEIIFWDNSLNF